MMIFHASFLLAALLAHSSFAQNITIDVDAIADWVPRDKPTTYQSQLTPCPISCLGVKPENWTVYSSTDRLSLCNQPLIFDLLIENPVDDSSTDVRLAACTTGDSKTTINAVFEEERSIPQQAKRQVADCVDAVETKVNLETSSSGSSPDAKSDVINAIEALGTNPSGDDCDSKILLGYSNGVVAGVYTGQSFQSATLGTTLDAVKSYIDTNGVPEEFFTQLCGNTRNAHHVLGVAISSAGKVGVIQEALKRWNRAQCVDLGPSVTIMRDVVVQEAPRIAEQVGSGNFTVNTTAAHSVLLRRADCRTTSVVSGDGCGTLASRCGISPADFTKFNSDPGLCSSLMPGQRVCCSSGTLSDIRPKPNADGTCAAYLVKSGDSCSSIAAANGLKIADLATFNDKTTWGWTGCNNLMAQVNICLSTGKPPLPAAVENAVCGPLVPGTAQPPEGESLAEQNPCPLNTCCNKWGQCGITADFCTKLEGPTGNPGTSPAGTHGCISNCGTDIVNTEKPFNKYERIGYYESWNFGRDCLYLTADRANTLGYSHIHWAFAAIDQDWNVVIDDPYNQWSKFKNLRNVKKIVSFGGWGYSTEPETYDILRRAMEPANRKVFAQKVVDFVVREGLHGADFDWEYPGAPDIPGIPPGLESDGINYLNFLLYMRKVLGTEKSLSIAAPASYWYLKAFPIDRMAKTIDYIVYMTYDLHGQWDDGSPFSVDGCPSGNCVRSHVNITETGQALSMITKAGVPTNKIFVGEASYGRSFKLEQPDCTGSMCKFTGDRMTSNAAPGKCTATGGYISNAEIKDILLSDRTARTWYDKETDSDYLLYRGTEWVGYMSPSTKEGRRGHWQKYNFAGTIDWAVDLQEFDEISERALGLEDDMDFEDGVGEPLPLCTGSGYDTLEQLDGALASIPFHCRAQYTLETLQRLLDGTMRRYSDLMNNGYDAKFRTYADAVVKTAFSSVEKFMLDNGNKYFDCVVTERIGCCSWCNTYYTPEDAKTACRYCENYQCEPTVCAPDGTGCDRDFEWRYRNVTQPCPPDYSLRGSADDNDGYYGESVYWTMRPGDAERFWGDLQSKTGIEQKDIAIRDRKFGTSHCPTSADCRNYDWYYGIPTAQGYEASDVLNPKSMVDKNYNNLKGLAPRIGDTIALMRKGDYWLNTNDLVDSVALPVAMIVEAVDNMATIEGVVEDMEEEKRKQIIMAFVTALLFFVPMAGQVLSAVASLANIGRIIAVLGTAGQLAYDIVDLVNNKGNAPMTIFSIVLAPLAFMDIVQLTRAANARRVMQAGDVAALGKNVGGKMAIVQKVTGVCLVR
ncbi:Endochitinase B [Elsinoe australis]|uniref:chitinase n=1 Tax=Elsinoe australis TaxID=40998 RepID=A0A2P7YL00_9PEZI|nr:Endochitinase B [Elsinoe australis]